MEKSRRNFSFTKHTLNARFAAVRTHTQREREIERERERKRKREKEREREFFFFFSASKLQIQFTKSDSTTNRPTLNHHIKNEYHH